MKITLFFLFIAISSTFAKSSYSQNTKLSLHLENVLIKQVFDEIQKSSEFIIFYKDDQVDLKHRSSIDLDDASVDQILDQALKGTNLGYKIFDRQIVISKNNINSKENPSVIKSETNAQQTKELSGSVTDNKGAPLPGVTVVVKGTTIGRITDAEGKFRISLPSDAKILAFSFVGMKTQEITVGDKTIINVSMQEETTGMGEVVVVGYGVQKKENVTGSISTVQASDLEKVPVASTANSLAGRLPGLISIQSSGQPGYDAATLSIRGFGTALVLVDGIETDFNSLDANEIESISILKDGSASIYGSRAGNGVILVTTKRGINQKPTIMYKSSYTMQGITAMPKTSSSGQYSEMVREGYIQSGQPEATAPYTLDEIQKFYNGTDPQYPNTNWYNQLIRDWAPQQQHNLSVRGGSDKVKYYGFLGYLDQKTIWKKSGGDYGRYNLQSNIDAKILDNLSMQVDIASTIESRSFPWRPMIAGDNTVWQDFWQTLPVYPATLPDPTKISFAGGGGTGGAHIVTNRDIAGYNDVNNQNIKGTIALNYVFKFIKGLSAKAFVNYSNDYSTTKNFQKPVQFYTYDVASQIYSSQGALSNNGLTITKNQSRMITGQLSLNYDNTFGKDHHLTGLVLFESIDYYSDWVNASRKNFLTYAIDQMFAGSTTGMTNNGSASEMGRESVVGRLNYSFKNKYLLETTLRADASAKFPANNRWGYFPSVSLGWRMSEENFMKQFEIFDDLKLKASAGSSGNDNVGNFQYLAGYNLGDIWSGGTYLLGSTTAQGMVSKGLANANLFWEKTKIYNLGLDYSLWRKKLYGSVDVFYRERTGIPATRITTLPSTFGSPLPPENINSLNNRGFELQIGTTGESRGFQWDISGNISWSRAKWDHYEEPLYTDPDQARIYTVSGRWTDQQFGYLSDGLFTSQEEINSLGYDQDNKGNTTLRPGDIKYKDENKDGIIDWKDQVVIGKGTTPNWMFGLNTNLKYKNFDLSALFQGAFGFYNYVSVPGGILSSIYYEKRWTEANDDPNAFFPRLGGASSNWWVSDHYYKRADYVRLKSLSVGYNIPQKYLKRSKIEQVRLYVAGTNLLTLSELMKYNIDPESPSGMGGYYYPQQKTITFGINLSL